MEKANGPDHPEVAGALRIYVRFSGKKAGSKPRGWKRAALIEQRHSRENLMGLTVDARVLR
jgi:hypothetical protein